MLIALLCLLLSAASIVASVVTARPMLGP